MDNNEIYKRLKALRKARQLSQNQVARRLNMVHSAYGKIERGQTQLTLDRLEQLAQVYKISVAEILQLPKHGTEKDGLDMIAMCMDMEVTDAGVNPFDDRIPYEKLTEEDLIFHYGRVLTEEEYNRMPNYPIPVNYENIQRQFDKIMENPYAQHLFALDLIDNADLKDLWIRYKQKHPPAVLPIAER